MSFEIPASVKVWSQFAHPLLMWVLLGLTIYALYSGIQYRRTRSADKEVRKELIQKDFRTKHYQVGSILLALMVLGTIGALGVTYINNGKLFVGAHLIAGLGLAGLTAISASLSPLMQAGKEWARISHISLNVSIVGIFLWQTLTGFEIVQRILDQMAKAVA